MDQTQLLAKSISLTLENAKLQFPAPIGNYSSLTRLSCLNHSLSFILIWYSTLMGIPQGSINRPWHFSLVNSYSWIRNTTLWINFFSNALSSVWVRILTSTKLFFFYNFIIDLVNLYNYDSSFFHRITRAACSQHLYIKSTKKFIFIHVQPQEFAV